MSSYKKYVTNILFVLLIGSIVTGCKRPPLPMTKKPVIYLYPEKTDTIQVGINFKGKIKSTYPNYDKGWTVVAEPNGILTNLEDQQEYSYLFYDGQASIYQENKKAAIENGFVVSNEEIIPFLQKKLKHIGLKPKEYNDMISYWLPELTAKNYCAIRFKVNNECNQVSELNISPKPDTEIRVMMEFQSLASSMKLTEQKLPHLERNGFTMVEWGGTNLTDQILVQ